MNHYIILFLMIICVMPSFGRDFKYNYEGQTITYTVLDEESKIVETKGNNNTIGPGNYCSGTLILPEHPVDNGIQYTLTSIGIRSFTRNPNLSEVIIPKTVTSIENYAFQDCTGLEKVNIPENVVSIGFQTFYGCSLTSVTIPESIKSIGPWAFSACNSLETVNFNAVECTKCGTHNNPAFPGTLKNLTIGNGVTLIPEYAFKDCSELQNINIPESVNAIGKYSFFECKNIKTIDFPSNLETIGDYSFYGCSNLTSINLSEGLTSIGEYCFATCSCIKSVTIPKSVTSIGGFAFFIPNSLEELYFNAVNCSTCGSYNNPIVCSELKQLIIGNEVTNIPEYSFYNCKELTSLIIPASVLSIGDMAFNGCLKLSSITIPEGISTIGSNAFSGCSSLESLYYNAMNCQRCGGYNSSLKVHYSAFPSSLKNIILGDCVTYIPQDAFYNCKEITSIRIPEVLSGIGKDAFANCLSLSSVTSNSLEKWLNIKFENTQANPLYYAKKLIIGENTVRRLNIPETISRIDDFAFYNCESILTVDIPASLKSIGEVPFGGCSNLQKINLQSTNQLFSLSHDGPDSQLTSGNSAKYYINSELYEPDYIQLSESINDIPDYAFYEWRTLEEISIPKTVKSIGTSAFYGCERLKKVNIENANVWARIKFSDKYSNPLVYAKNLYIGKNNEPITRLVIEGKDPISDYAFYGAQCLKRVRIKDCASIGDDSFYGCSRITDLCINTSIIGNNSFGECNNITNVFVPLSIPPIASDDAFSRYDRVKLYVPSGSISKYENAENCWWKFLDIQISDFADIESIFAPDYLYVEKEIEALDIDPQKWTTRVGTKLKLNVTFLPNDASIKTLIWTTSDNSIASIDDDGTVTARKIGKALITASTTDGSDLSATCEINVIPTLVTSISFDYEKWTGKVGEKVQVSAEVLPYDATDKTLAWSSSDESIASVSDSGIVTAISVGEAVITAQATDSSKVSASCKVTVIATPVTSISIDRSEWSGKVGEIIQLTAIVLPEDATDKSIVWTSSDESVAIVSNEGVVTAVGVGDAMITVKSTDGSDVSASCKVSVLPTPATSISIDRSEWSGKVGETIELAATVLPEDATEKSIVWASSDDSVATVTIEGLVTAVRVGEAVITAKATDGSDVSASCKVTVIATPVTLISIDRSEWSGKVGETIELAATVLPEDATDKSIVWTSSDETVATVSNEGLVTAVKVGEAVITAKSTDGTDVSAFCKVTVIMTPVTSISIDRSDWSGKVGYSIALTATVYPEDATDKTIIWISDNEAVATVDGNGNVTAVSLGTATISASCGNIYAYCTVTVVATPVESIVLSQNEAQLKVSESVLLTAYVYPENATDKIVVWTSDNEAVAKVDAEGKVTAVSVGRTVIYASCGDYTAYCIVTVEATMVERILLSLDNWSGIEGESFRIEATVLPENATDKTLEWTSSDESVATVDNEGNVSVLSEGTCVITASATDGSEITAVCIITGQSGVYGLFSSDVIDVYDFNGVLIKKNADRESLKLLTPGIYIIRQGSEMKKLIIR